MSEPGEFQIEDALPEMDMINRCGLFTKNEIRDIIVKRKSQESKLQKVSKAKEDIIRYITFEIELLMNIKIKANEKGLQQKTTNLEYSLANRITKLYYFALRKFPGDIKIWLSFIKFCKHMNLYTCVSRLFDQMLELHVDKPGLFKLAASWEFHECNSIERARKFILKGLHTHKNSKMLFSEAFRIELSYIKQKLEQQKDNDEKGKNESLDPTDERNFVNVLYTSALKKIDDITFLVELLNIAQEFSFTESLQSIITQSMKTKFPNEEITWDTLARRELTLNGTLQEKIGRCIAVYQDGLGHVQTKKMWLLYIDYVLELNEDLTTLPILKKNCLKKAFETGHKENMLSEKHYMLWIKKIDNVDACKVLEWGTERFETSHKLWTWRLRNHLSKFDEKGAMAVFRKIISKPDIPDQISFWMLILKCYQIIDIKKAESLWKEGVENPTVGEALKGRYIEWVAMTRGILAARNSYSKLFTKPPFSLDLHQTMAKLEDAQPKVNVVCTRGVYENAINQYGKTNTDVWLWYLNFEAKFGEPGGILKVYDQAIKTLNSNLVNTFISEYNLNEADIKKNSSGKNLQLPKEEETWDSLARRELTLFGTSEEKIRKCISVYEDGLKKVPTQKMWSLYLDYVLEINEDASSLVDFKKDCLKKAFEAAHKESMLSEKHYLLWVSIVDVDTCKVLKWGTEKFVSSNKLWAMRLRHHLSKKDEAGAMEVFNEISSHPAIPDKASLWMLILEFYQVTNVAKAERLWNEGINNPLVGAALKGRYIEWLAMTHGILSARIAYSTLSITPPISLDIHVAMSKLEDAQPEVNVKSARQVHENAVNQYGKSNTDVWLWYIKFEAKFGEKERVPKIYDQAVKTLNSHLVDAFISEYHLNVAETINKDRGANNQCPIEFTWNTLARRELELRGALEERAGPSNVETSNEAGRS